MSIADTIDCARRAFEIAGRGCLVRISEDEPRYATVAEIAALGMFASSRWLPVAEKLSQARKLQASRGLAGLGHTAR